MNSLDFLDDMLRPIKTYRSVSQETNVFQAVSDVFYRENFHSDLLAYYLSDDLVKRKLIDWINGQLEGSLGLEIADYENGAIRRESGRIDIAIFSYDHEKCIIIENKSNDAFDQDRQLPRYLEYLQKQNVKVEAIIYLNKTTLNGPTTVGWTESDIAMIGRLLLPTRLVGPGSFSEKVIDQVLVDSRDIRLTGLSHEIKSLFRGIIFGGINMEDLSGFARELQEHNNLEKLKKAIVAYNDLPKYWREHYMSKAESMKFDGRLDKTARIAQYKETCLVLDNFRIGGINFGVDLWFSHQKVDISILTRNGTDNDIDDLKSRTNGKWLFGNQREFGRYRFYILDPFDEIAIAGAIENIIEFFGEFA